MPPKKRQHASEERPTVSVENPTNSEKGLLRFPIELRDEVMLHFRAVNKYTEAPYNNPILRINYLERTDALRALSQVSVAYRRVFLPCLWEAFMACHEFRSGQEVLFFAHAGKTLARKCDGLSRNPELAAHVRRAHVVVTRYKSAAIVPKFASLLSQLPNLHTLHILHAHTLISKALKQGFVGIRLPQIRTLIMPGYCHEILKCCPGAKTIWCIREDGRKLVPVICTDCKEVEELRGFQPDDKVMKKIVKGVPNLRVYEILDGYEDVFLMYIKSFEKLNTIILRPYKGNSSQTSNLEATIKKCVTALKCLPPTDKRRLFISQECVFDRARRWKTDDWQFDRSRPFVVAHGRSPDCKNSKNILYENASGLSTSEEEVL